MKKLFPDLWQTPLETRFGTLKSHAYILEHEEGREMIYVAENSETLHEVLTVRKIDHLYLSHNHEITEGLANAKSTLGATMVGHREMNKYFPVGPSLDQTIAADAIEKLPGGLEAIYTLGHADSNLCYRYKSPYGKTYLFVGDTLYPDHGTWKALFMTRHGGNKATLCATLEQLKAVQVDIVIPSVALGKYQISEMNAPQWSAALDCAIASLN